MDERLGAFDRDPVPDPYGTADERRAWADQQARVWHRLGLERPRRTIRPPG